MNEAHPPFRSQYHEDPDATTLLLRGTNYILLDEISELLNEVADLKSKLRKARRELRELRKVAKYLPSVVPCVDGGVQLEWHSNGIDLEIYFSPEGNISFIAEDIESGNIAEAECFGSEGLNLLREWLAKVNKK